MAIVVVGGILMVVLYLVRGGDPSEIPLDGGTPTPARPSAGQDPNFDLASVILGGTEEVWSGIFSAAGLRYVPQNLWGTAVGAFVDDPSGRAECGTTIGCIY